MLAEKVHSENARKKLTERIRKLLERCSVEELELVVLFLERYLHNLNRATE